jgi:surface polysaccharide O-acyltransferase-like enzyme
MAYVTMGASVGRTLPRDALSAELDTLRLALIVSLVFLRYGAVPGSDSLGIEGYHGQAAPLASIAVSFAAFFSFSAVPMLAAISGWLFFRGATPDRMPEFAPRWRKRVRSLLLPSVLWSAGALVGALALMRLGVSVPSAADLDFSAGPFAVANAVLGLTEAPFAVQFWFVRDLILSVALAPLVWLAASRAPRVSVAILAAAWLADQDFGIFLRLDTILFFVVGAALAIHRVDVRPVERLAAPLAAAFLLALTARTFAPWATGQSEGLWLDLLTAAMRVLGVAALWSAAGLLARGPAGAVARVWGPAAFFVYCAHYPLIAVVKRVLGAVMRPETDLELLAHFAATVGVTLAVIAGMVSLLSAVAPRALSVLSGGRLSRD